MDILRK